MGYIPLPQGRLNLKTEQPEVEREAVGDAISTDSRETLLRWAPLPMLHYRYIVDSINNNVDGRFRTSY